MEGKILKLLESESLRIDSRSLSKSGKIVQLYSSLQNEEDQLKFKNTILQLLHSYSNVNGFAKFADLLYAALEIKPPNLDHVLYEFLINNIHKNEIYNGSTSRQILLKAIVQIPVNPVYVQGINDFFLEDVDDSILLNLLHFLAKKNFADESLLVLNKICNNQLYKTKQPILYFQFATSLKYINPKKFEVWFQNKIKDQIPKYILTVLKRTFVWIKENYHENWVNQIDNFLTLTELALENKTQTIYYTLQSNDSKNNVANAANYSPNGIEVIDKLILSDFTQN